MPIERGAYEIRFLNDGVRKEYEALYGSVREAERRRFDAAFAQLERDPYPTNPDITGGTIIHLSGVEGWRYKVSYFYRLSYDIQDQLVIITAVGHRKDVYRRL